MSERTNWIFIARVLRQAQEILRGRDGKGSGSTTRGPFLYRLNEAAKIAEGHAREVPAPLDRDRIEAAAQALYENWAFYPNEGFYPGAERPPWTPHGNSIRQEEARALAAAAVLAFQRAMTQPQEQDNERHQALSE